jgi:pyrroline-5-carboxylate reductase
MKIAIIGVGNMGGAIARGLAKGSLVKATDLICTAHTQQTLDNLLQFDQTIGVSLNNIEAVCGADIVILAVKPWKLEEVIAEIKDHLDYNKQIIVSVAGGVPALQLENYLIKNDSKEGVQESPTLFRVIPNTAIEVMCGMTFISSLNASEAQETLMHALFSELGKALIIEEKQMEAATALASCGIAFALRYIRAATEGGVELGMYPVQAREIVAQTVKGAAELLLLNQSHPEVEIDKVTTAGGITIRGLNEMEANGFTSAVIKGLKASK